VSSPGFLKQVLSGFMESLQPLQAATASPEAFASFLGEFGWTLTPSDLTHVTGSLEDLSTLATDPSSLNVEQLAGEIISLVRPFGPSPTAEHPPRLSRRSHMSCSTTWSITP
jgi:hypothetical protein